MVHSDRTYTVEMGEGKTIADALPMIGYPKQGHASWCARICNAPVSLNTIVTADTKVKISHRSMGNP